MSPALYRFHIGLPYTPDEVLSVLVMHVHTFRGRCSNVHAAGIQPKIHWSTGNVIAFLRTVHGAYNYALTMRDDV